jgi:hypothetical protein
MPCYSGYDNNSCNCNCSSKIEYKEVVKDNPKQQEKIIQLKDEVKRLEAGLCAIISELERLEIANQIISQASKSGLINLMDFWAGHSNEDESRIARALHQFSEHEQIVMKKLLNKNYNL